MNGLPKPVAVPIGDVHRCPSRAWTEMASLMDDVYEAFADLGIATVPASRIRTYRDAFSSLIAAEIAGRPITQEVAEVLLHAQIELSELRKILEASTASGEREHWMTKLRALVSGSAVPNPTVRHRDVRDAQFECLLAAVSELSGYATVFEEPDVVVELPSTRIGIAAKTPRSATAFDKNIRAAAKQVRRSGLPGVVAVNLSRALLPRKCIHAPTLEAAGEYAKLTVDTFVVGRLASVRHAYRDANVAGLLACLTVPAMIHKAGLQIATATRWSLFLLQDVRAETARELVEFIATCERGLFGPRSEC